MQRASLELGGSDVPQVRMTPLPIVPDFDVGEHLLTGYLPRGEATAIHQLLFERSKEGLDGCVVPAVTLTAQAGLHALILHAMSR